MKTKTKDFFNRHAGKWDAFEEPDNRSHSSGRLGCRRRCSVGLIINAILDRICIQPDDRILDVGCGTGILTTFFEKRRVKHFTGIDFSPKMIEEYKKKFPCRKALVGDFEKQGLFKPDSFTKVIIYNAFPHFKNHQKVFANAFAYLKPKGGLYIVHSMTRTELDRHHRKAGGAVADHVLPSDKEFRRFYAAAGFKDIEVDDSNLFYSRGIKPR